MPSQQIPERERARARERERVLQANFSEAFITPLNTPRRAKVAEWFSLPETAGLLRRESWTVSTLTLLKTDICELMLVRIAMRHACDIEPWDDMSGCNLSSH